MAKQVALQEGTLALDPGVILAEENSRYGLKRLRVESLMASILERGGVMQAVEVEPLPKPVDGKHYRLTSGFYRHAAVSELNEKQGAGLTLPATIKPVPDPVERLKRQLAENMERENQSPMDKAVAIQRLVQASVPKIEIRKIFSTPGGRKGLANQPASNAFVNMTLSFLDLPKAIQEKIHDGRVGVAAAYELTKVSPDKRAAVLERAEEQRQKAIDAEEKEEERYLANEKAAAEAREKEAAAMKEAQAKAEALKAAEDLLAEKRNAAAEAYRATTGIKGEAKAKAEEAFKAAEADAKGAEAAVDKLTKEVSKANMLSEKAAQKAQEQAAKLEAARNAVRDNAGNKGKTAVGGGDVKKAAAAVEGSQTVKLNASEMRRVVDELTAAGMYPKVREIAKAFKECFDGVLTDRQLYTKLATITGEKKAAAKK